MAAERLKYYLPYINQLPNTDMLEKSDLINDNFLMEKDGALEMYYAPHNEYINRHAKIVIVGITPGWTQMKAAFRQAKICLMQGASLGQLMQSSKKVAGFAGTMRRNLIDMLDACEINTAFHLSSSRLLFCQHQHLLHTTSIIKYPVFVNGKNYTGYAPKITHSSMLAQYAYQTFPKELRKIQNEYVLVPLGNAVSEVIRKLASEGKIPGHRCLFGFPHPSGANGHRVKQLSEVKAELKCIVGRFAQELDG